MSKANQTRREVMLLAWGSFRAAFGLSTFADCLRRAWAYLKRIGRPVQRVMKLSPSLIQSPIRRSLTGERNGRRLDWSAAYTTAQLGR